MVGVDSHDPWPARTGTALLTSLVLLAAMIVSADEEISRKPEDWDKRLEMFRSVPYLDLSETIVDESDTGVVFSNPQKSHPGYNIYCTRMSGEAFLLDMEGRAFHRWTYLHIGGSGSYHHVVMLNNGDLMVIKEYQKLLRLNWDSQLIWERELAVHHDVAPSPDGTFFVIVQEDKMHRGMRMWFDALVHLTAAGEEIDRWSTYDHLADIESVLDTRSFLDTIIDRVSADWEHEDVTSHEGEIAMAYRRDNKLRFHLNLVGGRKPEGMKADAASEKKSRYHYDYFHMNAVSVLSPTQLGDIDTRFQPGNLLICFRNVNQIAVLEKDTYRPLWAWGEGELDWPHHATMLENGHVFVFDNGIQRGYSRVVEMDPVTETIVWEYSAQRPEDFHSKYRGSAQRLSNGNTLICESDIGRVFEVTEEGEVVWTWLNPTTRDGRREALYRFMRLPAAQVERLQQRWWWWE
jgi:hypothetical protein